MEFGYDTDLYKPLNFDLAVAKIIKINDFVYFFYFAIEWLRGSSPPASSAYLTPGTTLFPLTGYRVFCLLCDNLAILLLILL